MEKKNSAVLGKTVEKKNRFSAVFWKNGGEKKLNFFLPFTLAPSSITRPHIFFKSEDKNKRVKCEHPLQVVEHLQTDLIYRSP